jgi:hypothetical protein
MLDEFELFWPEEAVGVEIELVKAFLGEAFPGREVGRMSRKWWKREERVFGDAAYSTEFFR